MTEAMRQGPAVKRAAILVAVVAVLMGSAWVSAEVEQGRPRNGQAIYEDFCFRCHGLKGKGDGPDAGKLKVKPANFQSPQSRSKTEFELLTIVSNGVAFTPMHTWRGKMSDEEMIEVVRYIRQLAPHSPGM
jgi:cytochrome c oxidase cbb3-type subunit 3